MTLNKMIFFLIVLAHLFCSFGVMSKIMKICRVYQIKECELSPNAKLHGLHVKEFRIYNPERANTIFYMEAEMKDDLHRDPRLEILVRKCLNRESLDTCEILTTLKPSNPCMFMFMKNMMWSNFVHNIEPKLSCRVKKGNYILKNATVEPDLFQVFPITGFFWRIELKFMGDTPDVYTSVCVDAQVISVIVPDDE